MSGHQQEGLRAARIIMVLCSFSPLFVLWAIRGTRLIADRYFVAFCLLMAVLPNIFLLLRIRTAKKLKERRELVIGSSDDHRDHLVVYLFVMLLPLYPVELGAPRELVAVLMALAFVVFIFWHLNLHYMNLLFAIRGYRVFTIHPPADGNPLTGKVPLVLITNRVALSSGERVVAYRLSDTVYFEVEE